MREQDPAEDTCEVYGTLADYLRRHTEGGGSGPRGRPYIRLLSRRMDFTYCLVSGYIPLFRTDCRPW